MDKEYIQEITFKSSFFNHIHDLMKKKIAIYLAACALPIHVTAQELWQEEDVAPGKLNLCEGVEYGGEMQGSLSKGKTPLWLNANKYGLSSLDERNGYMRVNVIRPLAADSARRWAVGYGVDVVAPVNYTSHAIVQQAFVEARWLHGVLSVGAKEYPLELKNQTLSSGSQTLGINARPVPQVRLALPDYWTLPIFNGWVHLKGHIAYGMMTDDSWQHDFTNKEQKYADEVLYHSKAGYLKIGSEERFCPWSLEMGVEMADLFGGKPYFRTPSGEMILKPSEKGLRGFWHAFFPGGADPGENEYINKAGDIVGSWVMRFNYDFDSWKLGIYADHFFEDDSQLFFLDYNGYGEGPDEWNEKKYSRFFLYSFKDIMLGTELNFKYSKWLRNVVIEYLYTKYQSGPYNHDRTINIPDHLSGTDDYYNHGTFTGWQHWGQVMGNPLYRSPIYNNNGKIEVLDNRFIAYHLGFDGQPTDRFGYRALVTYQKGWGTYNEPFTKKHHNVSFLVEGNYAFSHGWAMKAGYGMDFGSNQMLGHNAGFQLTVSKKGNLGKKKSSARQGVM